MKARKHLDMLVDVQEGVDYDDLLEELNPSTIPASETKLRELVKDAKVIEKMRVKVNKDFDRELKKAIKKAEGRVDKEEEKA